MNENKKLSVSDLWKKYGDVKVMGIPAHLARKYTHGTFTPVADAIVKNENIVVPLLTEINLSLIPMLRRTAELNPHFKQVIPYVVVTDKSGNIFVTRRISGDDRLVGSHSIGTGGHIDEGETLNDGMYRELAEEIDLTQENIDTCSIRGYISDESTAVNAVHLGVVIRLVVHDPLAVTCIETDKLEGKWMSVSEVRALHLAGKLESWSKIAFSSMSAEILGA